MAALFSLPTAPLPTSPRPPPHTFSPRSSSGSGGGQIRAVVTRQRTSASPKPLAAPTLVATPWNKVVGVKALSICAKGNLQCVARVADAHGLVHAMDGNHQVNGDMGGVELLRGEEEGVTWKRQSSRSGATCGSLLGLPIQFEVEMPPRFTSARCNWKHG